MATGGGQPPARVAGFGILGEIGRGGMGIVYRAYDEKLGRHVALKRPKPELMGRADFTKRFLREARTASRLMHPNITTVFSAFEEDGVPWLAMELIEGGSLRQRLRDGGPLPIGEVLVHAEGLADALRVAHENGVLHADINPNNILLGRDGRARLTDFGLARARAMPGLDLPVLADSDIPSWSTPEAAGTHGYMAPEQVRGGRMDERSDIFCLGLVVSEMCTGRAVFAGKNTVEWVGAVIEGRTEKLARPGPETPPELGRVIARATAARPRDRYQSAGAMAGDIRTMRRYSESGVELAIVEAAHARKRTQHVLLAIGAVAVIATAVVLIKDARKHPLALKALPLTSAPGWEGDPALSPDGSMVAYASDETGNDEIWVMDIESRNAVKLTDDPATDRHPAWFPGGRSLAFASDRGGEPGIWTVAASGGKARLLVARAEDPAISPDGERIAFAVRDASGTLRVAVAPLADPAAVTVLTGANDGAFDQRDPTWSPDGLRICYQDFSDLWTVSADGGPARMLTDHQAANLEPAWSADGHFIYFRSSREGPLALWRMRAAGGAPERVTMGTGPEVQPALSRDGRRLAYATRREDENVGVRDLKSASAKSWQIASTAADLYPACAPDGSSVAFVSGRLGTIDLFLQRLTGAGLEGQPRRMTELPGKLAMPAFSRDGRWIAFHRVVNGERNVWIMPSAGGAPTNLTNRAGVDLHPAFSPDMTRMAFVSDRAGGQHVWEVVFANGRLVGIPRQITFGEGVDYRPSWAPDGRRIVFIRNLGNESAAWVVDAEPVAQATVVTHGVWVECVCWGPHDSEILVSALWDRKTIEVRTVSLNDGSVRPEEPPLVLGPAGAQGSFDVNADGRIVAFDLTTVTGDIWVADGLPGGD